MKLFSKISAVVLVVCMITSRHYHSQLAEMVSDHLNVANTTFTLLNFKKISGD